MESSARFRMWFLYHPYNRINMSVAIAQVKQAKAAVHWLGPIKKQQL
jgi:hypothetical protein